LFRSDYLEAKEVLIKKLTENSKIIENRFIEQENKISNLELNLKNTKKELYN